MEFRVLGPVEALRNGASLALGGPKQRTVLALLLVNANRVVPTEVLIDQLWAGIPPQTADKALQGYVSKLRRVLERDGPSEVIATKASGYELRADPGQIDACRFERALEDGRRALEDGRARQAARTIGEALELWRGPPFADLAYESCLQKEIHRLEQLRLAALHERIDAKLTLGRHADVVGELETLTTEHPLDERLRGQLMLALYRCGRQSEALAAYSSARTTLADELGIEPGEDLRRLQRAILNHDPELRLPAAEPVRTRLPAPPTRLIGRHGDVEAVCAMLRREDVRFVTVTGAGGIGKTRLAIEAAARLERDTGCGAVFVDLASLSDPAVFLPTLAQALDVRENGTTSLTEALALRLRDVDLLLVLDNFEQILPAAPQLAELLAGSRGLKALVTSRAPLRMRAEHEHPLAPLSLPDGGNRSDLASIEASDAVALYCERARAVWPDFRLTEENAWAVAEICRRLDGLPLAIELAVSRARRLSPEALLARLERPLEYLAQGPGDLPARQQTMRRTIAWSYELLDDTTRRFFTRLGVFAGGCTEEAAGAVCAGETADCAELLDALVDRSLLVGGERENGDARFAMLETVREFALEQLEASGNADDARQLHAEHLLDVAERAASGLRGPEQTRALTLLQTERANLQGALAWFVSSGNREHALRLALALHPFWLVRGSLVEGQLWLDQVLAGNGDAPVELRARALEAASVLALKRGDLARARSLADRSVRHFVTLKDPPGLAAAMETLAVVARCQGQQNMAESLSASCADLYRSVGDEWGLAHNLNSMAELALERGDYDRAQALCEQSRSLFGKLEDKQAAALASRNRGLASLLQGELASARASLGESLRLAHELGDRREAASSLEGLAAILAEQGQAEKAARLLGAASALLDATDGALEPVERWVHDRTEAHLQRELGERLGEAWELGRALTLAEAVGEALSRAAGRAERAA